MLWLLNSKICNFVWKILSQTLALNINDIVRFPVIVNEDNKNKIENIVKENIDIEKQDRDSSEISWDFKQHPFIKYKSFKNPKFIC